MVRSHLSAGAVMATLLLQPTTGRAEDVATVRVCIDDGRAQGAVRREETSATPMARLDVRLANLTADEGRVLIGRDTISQAEDAPCSDVRLEHARQVADYLLECDRLAGSASAGREIVRAYLDRQDTAPQAWCAARLELERPTARLRKAVPDGLRLFWLGFFQAWTGDGPAALESWRQVVALEPPGSLLARRAQGALDRAASGG